MYERKIIEILDGEGNVLSMKVKCRVASPVRQKDGSWKVITEKVEEDIPDLGRVTMLCNKCGFKTCPKCMEFCSVGKNMRKSTDLLRNRMMNRGRCLKP